MPKGQGCQAAKFIDTPPTRLRFERFGSIRDRVRPAEPKTAIVGVTANVAPPLTSVLTLGNPDISLPSSLIEPIATTHHPAQSG